MKTHIVDYRNELLTFDGAVIGPLVLAGKTHHCACPFCGDEKGFWVNIKPEKRHCYCFECHAGGRLGAPIVPGDCSEEWRKEEAATFRTAVNRLRDEAFEIASNHGFHDGPVSTSAYCANLHGEVSELWEAYRHGTLHSPCDKADAMKAAGLDPLTCLEEELADIIIRALDMAGACSVDIGKAVAVKTAFNRTRSHRHGGKKA